MNIRTSGPDVVFEYQHLETEEFSSRDVFKALNLTFWRGELTRTHWALKQGDAIGELFKFFASRSRRDRPMFFDVDEWPLPNLGHVAVMMPFEAEFDPVYEVIEKACESLYLDARRVDQLHGPRRIVDDIFKTIMQSAVVISDITGMNPNVFYETGLAHARNRQVILIAQDSKFPFDIQSYLPGHQVLGQQRRAGRTTERPPRVSKIRRAGFRLRVVDLSGSSLIRRPAFTSWSGERMGAGSPGRWDTANGSVRAEGPYPTGRSNTTSSS